MKTSASALVKIPVKIVDIDQGIFFLRRKQNSPIASHARLTIKECNHATCTGDK